MIHPTLSNPPFLPPLPAAPLLPPLPAAPLLPPPPYLFNIPIVTNHHSVNGNYTWNVDLQYNTTSIHSEMTNCLFFWLHYFDTRNPRKVLGCKVVKCHSQKVHHIYIWIARLVPTRIANYHLL